MENRDNEMDLHITTLLLMRSRSGAWRQRDEPFEEGWLPEDDIIINKGQDQPDGDTGHTSL